MSAVGPLYPSAASDGGGGTGGPWTSLSNVYASDNAYASGDISSGGSQSSVLVATGYGFTLPVDAVINGIVVEVERNGFQAADNYAQLVKGGTLVGFIGGTLGVPSSDAFATFGGPTNLWGQTWTAADINASNFGAGYSAYNTHGGGNINVDTMRITVYWTAPPKPQDIAQPKRYIYKVYTGAQYLGSLPTPMNDYTVSQDINTCGSQISLMLPYSIDTAALYATDTINDETGAPITDESGNNLLTEGAVNLVGVGSGNSLIKNGNTVVVVEYSYYYPNGHTIFRGVIERWEGYFGGNDEEAIKVLIYSDGSDLDNYLVQGSPFSYTADQSQATQNASAAMNYTNTDKITSWNFYGQTWTVGTGVTNVGAIAVMLNGSANVTVKMYTDASATTLMGTTTQSITTSGAQVVQFNFSQHIFVTAGSTYFFTVTVDGGQSITIYYSNANPYAGGQMYNSNFTGTSGGSWLASTGNDLYFVTYSSNGSTTATFTSVDPTIGMLKPIIDDYVHRGGKINYGASTVDTTGLSLTYQYNTNTVYEAIQKTLEVSPNGFYYYVDLGTDTLYFKQASTNADIIVCKGKEIESITVVATIENVKNSIYVSGGIPAGQTTNLYKAVQNATSMSLYGQRLDRRSDVHATDSTAVTAIGVTALATQKDEMYQTVVTILDKQMDITTLHPGLIVAFRGYGTFVDSLKAQIVRVDLSPNEAVCTLGILPKRLNPAFEKVTRGLIAQQTIANPTTPS